MHFIYEIRFSLVIDVLRYTKLNINNGHPV